MGNVLTELERAQNQQQNRRGNNNRIDSQADSGQNDNQPTRPNKQPSSWDAIKNDNPEVFSKTEDDVNKQLKIGVYWDNRKKKYWVDNRGNNCFKVFANGLKITWSDNPNYWYLQKKSDDNDENITIAQLRNVAWLEVHGSFKGAELSPNITYQVLFDIKLEPTSYGWEVPVNFKLKVPGQVPKIINKNFKNLNKDNWIHIQIGEFKSSSKDVEDGNIEFSLYEYDGGSWKRGLIIKGVTIKPKYD